MGRNLTAAMIAQLKATHAKPATFVQIGFSNETIYVWSGVGPIVWNGHTWLGMGWLGTISAVPETNDVRAQNITLALTGIPTELMTDAIAFVRQNSPIKVWFGFLDDSNNVIADPTQSFSGHCDVPSVTDGSDTCTISITGENPMVDLDRAPNRRFTDCDQQQDYPGDLGFSFVGTLQNLNVQWPKVQ